MTQGNGPLLAALDAGSGGGRCVIFTEDGAVVAAARRSWEPTATPGLEPFGYEFDHTKVWSLLAESTREALHGLDASRLRAVSVTALRLGCAFLDANGETLYLGPNRDIRALNATLAYESLIDPDFIYRISRHWPPWVCAPSRLCWFKERAPETFRRIRYAVSFSDWMLQRLCGVVCGEPSSGGDLMFLDIAGRRWSRPLVEAVGWDFEEMPPLSRPGDVAGHLSEKAAAETGLPAGLPVVVGGGDTQCALLGSGVTEARHFGVVAGSSAPVMMAIDTPILDEEGKLWTDCHVMDDLWLLEANVGEAGALHHWMLETMGADLIRSAQETKKSPFELFDAEARKAEPCSGGATCHLGPRRFNLRNLNTGRPAAILMPFGETTGRATSRAELFRAYFENCAFAIRANLERLESVAGDKTSAVTISGGMSRSKLFCEIVAAVLNRDVQSVAVPEASALGAAVCAAKGAGLADSLQDGASKMVRRSEVFEPDEDTSDLCNDGYEKWLEYEDYLEQI